MMREVNIETGKILSFCGLEGSGCNLPAGQESGDFFEFISCNEDSVFTVIGDVMGKGYQAARKMEILCQLLRQCIKIDSQPLEVIRRLNTLGGYELRKQGSFATLCLLCYDVITGRLTCVNAGHHPPLFVSNGQLKAAQCRGVALGLLEEYLGTGVEEIFLAAGDAVVLYTDGLIEACGPDQRRYGLERLKEIVRSQSSTDAEGMRKNILADLSAFTQGISQKDDVTLVVMKVTEKGSDRSGD
ncbi:MAG: PP2C family protein-serine/threonine phosphatase [Bacillota bacterium]